MPSGGDERFEKLLAEFGGYLRAAVARRFPRGLGLDIEDVVQEARIKLWQALQGEKKIENPASYISRVAMTATVDAMRRVQARKEEAEAGDQDDRFAHLPDPSPSPERRAELSETFARIESALASLPADRALAVRLHLQGLGVAEAAEVTGWSEARARNLIYRGLADFRKELAARGIEHEDR